MVSDNCIAFHYTDSLGLQDSTSCLIPWPQTSKTLSHIFFQLIKLLISNWKRKKKKKRKPINGWGNGSVDSSIDTSLQRNGKTSTILSRKEQLKNDTKTLWHFYMLFPHCLPRSLVVLKMAVYVPNMGPWSLFWKEKSRTYLQISVHVCFSIGLPKVVTQYCLCFI